MVDLQSGDSVGKEGTNAQNGNSDGNGNSGVIDLASPSEPAIRSRTGGSRTGAPDRQRPHQPRRRDGEQEKVVDLLDSDSDDDVVEIVDTAPKRRRRN